MPRFLVGEIRPLVGPLAYLVHCVFHPHEDDFGVAVRSSRNLPKVSSFVRVNVLQTATDQVIETRQIRGEYAFERSCSCAETQCDARDAQRRLLIGRIRGNCNGIERGF